MRSHKCERKCRVCGDMFNTDFEGESQICYSCVKKNKEKKVIDGRET